MVARLSREPLVHFLLLGLLLFLLYAVLGGSGGDRSIKVDERVVAALTEEFQRTWQRPPTTAETNTLIESYVREEIFYREGMALGLDRDDPSIKRRVRQKFEVMAEESEAAEPPTDAQLNDWLKSHADRYAEPALATFEQILVDPTQEGRSAKAAVQAARRALASGADPSEIGTGRMIPPRFDLFPLDLVERDLGAGFARSLSNLRPGQWEGPIRSGYGYHLVKVDRLVPGRAPSLDEVRRAVARDWEAGRRKKAVDAYYDRLKKEYQIELAARP